MPLLLAAQAPPYKWVEDFSGGGIQVATDIAVDVSSGTAVVVGYYSMVPPVFSTFFNTNYGSVDGFVAKLDTANGNVLWAFHIGGASADRVNAVSIDPSGNIFVTGSFEGANVEFQGTAGGSTQANAIGGSDFFVAKYNSAGILQWLRTSLTGANNDFGTGIDANATGCYVIGNHLGPFGVTGWTSSRNSPGVDMFCMHFDQGGNFAWAIDGGSGASTNALDVVALNPEVIIVGDYEGPSPMTFYDRNSTLQAAMNLPNTTTNSDGFIVSVSNGIFNYTNLISGPGNESISGITSDGPNFYITGSMQTNVMFPGGSGPFSPSPTDNMFVSRHLTSTASTTWMVAHPTTGISIGSDITMNNSGQLFITAAFFGTVDFSGVGGPALVANVSDVLLLSYGTNNSFRWAKHGTGANNDVGTGIEAFPMGGGVAVSGVYQDGITFDSFPLPNTGPLESGWGLMIEDCDANFTFPANAVCNSAGTLTPNFIARPGGTFSASSVNVVFNNTSTGEIDLGSSTPGSYDIIYEAIGGCQHTITITIDAPPTTADAGPDQNLCNVTTGTMAGNTPVSGSGTWATIIGPATFSNNTDPGTAVNGLAVGLNQFEWIIDAGACGDSRDTVDINVFAPPTTSMAGPDQNLCGVTASTLAANVAANGTGTWMTVIGPGVVTSINDPASGVTGLQIGVNEFEWVITSGPCAPSRDTVQITVDAPPSASNAGPDQNACISATITLNANVPGTGTGSWVTVTGPGSASTPTSPSSGTTGLAVGLNEFEWVISNGACPPERDTVAINLSELPTPSNAGPDQEVCGTIATMAANTALIGNGVWVLVSGAGIIASPGDPASPVNGLGLGLNEFEWVISNGNCPSSRDTMSITAYAPPSPSNAGANQTVCGFGATLGAVSPAIGTGSWQIVSGPGAVTTNTDPNSTVTGLGVGANEFEWVITNGVCPPTRDTVTITLDAPPSPSVAGPDQFLCGTTSTTLAGNIPGVGTGTWFIVSGSGTPSPPGNANAALTGLGIGTNSFEWVIANGVCPVTRDTVVIQVDNIPSPSVAGPDQQICIDTTDLAGNTPLVGTGTWNVILGPGVLGNAGSPTSGISGLTVGSHEVEWVISNGSCPPSRDTMRIDVDVPPTQSVTGPNDTICDSVFVLSANVPIVGTGIWNLVSGGGNINTPTNNNSSVTNLPQGVNAFEWQISNSWCPASRDTLTILVDKAPTPSNAGMDQNICGDSTQLASNHPDDGTGIWTLISGSGNISTPTDSFSNVLNLALGTNELVWTISNGSCPPALDTVSINVFAPPSQADAGPWDTICGTAIDTLNGVLPAIGTGQWTTILGPGSVTSPNDPGSEVTGLMIGLNGFEWVVSNGPCPVTRDTAAIFVSPAPTPANAGIPQQICGDSTQLSGNMPAIGNGLWTFASGSGNVLIPGDSNSSVINLATGLNQLVWTISTPVCSASSDTVDITVFVPPSPSVAGPPDSLCASTIGNLNAVLPAVGTGRWSVVQGPSTVTNTADPASPVTGLGIGLNSYEWEVSNGGCPPNRDTTFIFVFDTPTTANAGVNMDICGDSLQLSGNMPAIGTGFWTVIAGTSNVAIPGDSNSMVYNLNPDPGVNQLVWTISNGVCPASSDTVAYRSFELPSPADAGPSDTLCNGTLSNLNAVSPAIGVGRWTVVLGPGNISNTADPSSPVTGLGIGLNSFEWEISSGPCPANYDTTHILIDAMPTPAFAGADQQLCTDSTQLAGNMPAIGLGMWTVIAGSSNVSAPADSNSWVTGLDPGLNQLVWTISNGICPPSSDTVDIDVLPFPTPAAAGLPDTLCNQGSTTLNGNMPVTGSGQWNVLAGPATVVNPTDPFSAVNGLGNGNNIFEWVITNAPCPDSRDSTSIQRDQPPSPANAGLDATICSDSISLAANVPATGIGSWTVLSGTGQTNNPSQANTPVSGMSPGNNTFVWTISNGICPQSTDTVQVTVDEPPSPAIAGPDQRFCNETVTDLYAIGPSTGFGNWTVITGGGLVGNPGGDTTIVDNLDPGTNIILWTVSNGSCPPSEDSLIIIVDTLPLPVNAGLPDSTCDPGYQLNGNPPSSGNGLWSVIAGGGSVDQPDQGGSPASGLSEGVNTFVWTISNITCSVSDTVDIVRLPSPMAEAGPGGEICGDNFFLNGDSTSLTHSWTGPGNFATPSEVFTGVTVPAYGVFTFYLEASNGICAHTDSVDVTFYETPVDANAGPDQDAVPGTPIQLNATPPTIGIGQWTVPAGTISDPADPQASISGLSSGTYTLQWTVSNGTCPDITDELILRLIEIKIPTGFSPNGDGKNDLYVIRGLESFEKAEFQVFNRWGNLVYSSERYANDWNGNSSRGKPLVDDTYYYILDTGAEKINGYIVIKR